MGTIVEVQSDAAMWAIIVGFFSPVLLSLILQAKWSARTKAVVAFVVSGVIGLLTAWITGALVGLAPLSVVLLVFVTAIASYGQFWKPTGIAPAIEAATSAKVIEHQPDPSLIETSAVTSGTIAANVVSVEQLQARAIAAWPDGRPTDVSHDEPDELDGGEQRDPLR